DVEQSKERPRHARIVAQPRELPQARGDDRGVPRLRHLPERLEEERRIEGILRARALDPRRVPGLDPSGRPALRRDGSIELAPPRTAPVPGAIEFFERRREFGAPAGAPGAEEGVERELRLAIFEVAERAIEVRTKQRHAAWPMMDRLEHPQATGDRVRAT